MGQAGSSSGSASGTSVASLGLTIASDITSGSGTKSADDFKAAQAERAAEFGITQANLTDVTMRENLNTTLGNIESIRSAANVDPSSPTTAALMDRSTALSDRQRTATVVTERAQAADDLASADYLKRAGDFAVKQSYLKSATDVASALAKAGTVGG